MTLKQQLTPEKQLVLALRSGDYRQGVSFLRTDQNLFCCLGVACDIYDRGLWEDPLSSNYLNSARSFMGRYSLLPDEVRQWLGWKDSAGRLSFMDREGGPLHLTDLNDSGFTFKQIADIIDAGLVENALHNARRSHE